MNDALGMIPAASFPFVCLGPLDPYAVVVVALVADYGVEKIAPALLARAHRTSGCEPPPRLRAACRIGRSRETLGALL